MITWSVKRHYQVFLPIMIKYRLKNLNIISTDTINSSLKPLKLRIFQIFPYDIPVNLHNPS